MNKEQHRIWLNQELYIPVDDQGYCGVFAEGALGCVVQVRSALQDRTRFALKVPRFLADTVRENAYIDDVMATELKTIRAFYNEMGGANVDGLLPPQLAFVAPLHLRSNTDDGNDDARAQHRHYVWVRMEKGKGPRFCSIGGVGDQVTVFPAGIDKDTRSLLLERFGEFEKQERDKETHVVMTAQARKDQKTVYPIRNSLQSSTSVDAWFALPPSVLYTWASGSLQAAATCNRLLGWRTSDIVKLGGRLLKGVKALHSVDLLHADIRPANIMHSGEGAEAESYFLIDYCSFGKNALIFGSPGAADEQHTLGPASMPQRASPFYAPERRAGSENEAADTAVVLPIEAPPEPTRTAKKDGAPATAPGDAPRRSYLVKLGWSEDLLDGDHKPKKAVLDRMLSARSQPGIASNDAERLQRGDRLRLRDFVFEVEGTLDEEGTLIRCTDRLWQVHHDRLVVSASGRDCPPVIRVPRVVEIRHASAATDLYGIGAVLLYTAMCAGRSTNKAAKNKTKEDQETAAAQDRRFTELMRCLESTQYFQAVWPRIDGCVKLIEEHLGKDPASVRVNTAAANEPLTTLLDACKNTVLLIVSTAPAMSRVYTACNSNLAEFLLFVHFVLACVQRRSSLMHDEAQLPFCRDRLDTAKPQSPAIPAAQRMQQVGEILARKVVGPFELELSGERTDDQADRVRELGADDPIFRIELQKERRERQGLTANLKQVEERLKHTEGLTASLKDTNRKLEKERDQLLQETQEANRRLQEGKKVEQMLVKRLDDVMRKSAVKMKQLADLAAIMRKPDGAMGLVKKRVLLEFAERLESHAGALSSDIAAE